VRNPKNYLSILFFVSFVFAAYPFLCLCVVLFVCCIVYVLYRLCVVLFVCCTVSVIDHSAVDSVR
jgi:hypothetical protein